MNSHFMQLSFLITLVGLLAASRFFKLRAGLHTHVEHELLSVEQQLSDFESKVKKISDLGFQYMLSLSSESVNALADAEQIIATVRAHLSRARELVASSRPADWIAASQLLNQDFIATTAVTISGFKRPRQVNWRERLSSSLDLVGAELLRVSLSYRNSVGSLRERIPAAVRTLMDVGVRSAARMRLTK